MSSTTADVIVIGGGIAGSSVAYRLAQKRYSVVLLEKGRVGEEASGHCGGGVRQQDRDPAELPLAMEAIKIWKDMKDELHWAMVTEPLPPMIKQFVQSDKFYFRQALEGNFHIAGDITKGPAGDFDKSVGFSCFVEVGRWLPSFLPVLRNVRLIRAFTGILHYTPDRLPILDRAPGFENFFPATGFSGHGFCLGPVIGKLMAEWIAEGESSLDLNRFRCDRFQAKGV
jgi:glycine/D-amino acid oxidase-like deaminating enzyme